MIVWPKVVLIQRSPQYPTNEKQNYEDLQNTIKIHPQQFLTKLNPLVKKSINIPTTLEFRLKGLKDIRRTDHFLNAFFYNSR